MRTAFLALFAMFHAATSSACLCRVVSLSPGAKLMVQKNGHKHSGAAWRAAAMSQIVTDADRLQLESGDAALLCEQDAALRKVPVAKGQPLAVPCSGTSGRLAVPRQIVDVEGLAAGDSVRPWVIAPRASAVATATPLIRWRGVPGVKTYEVTVRGDDLEWSSTVIAGGNEPEVDLRYPATAPPLQIGAHYKVLVSANGLQSDESGGLGGGFWIVPEDELKKVRAEEAELRALGLDATNAAIVMATRYAAARLYSDAAAFLEAKGVERTGEVARLLADIYSATGGFDQAAAVLTRAIETGATDSDAGRGQTFERLAALSEQTGNPVTPWLEKAAAAYESAGDTRKAAEIRKSIGR